MEAKHKQINLMILPTAQNIKHKKARFVNNELENM
jgi:hypothetical protein